MLSNAGRTRIVAIGRLARNEFSDVCKTLGVSIESRSPGPVDVGSPSLLAVLVAVDEKNPTKANGQLLRLIADNALEYGVLLMVAALRFDLASQVQEQVITAANSGTKPRMLQDRLPDFVAIGLTQTELEQPQHEHDISLAREFARVLREHPTELGAETLLKIPKDAQDEFWEQDGILLKRAFSGFTEIILHRELGGRSRDSAVWRVEAKKEFDTPEPFVAKAAPRADLELELYNFCYIVRDHIPFPFRAPLVESRFVRGGSRALLVSAFVTRAQRLDDYLAQTTCPELPIATLFHNSLANWRKRATLVRNISLGSFYVDQQEQEKSPKTQTSQERVKPLLPDPDHLKKAHADCRTKKLPSPADLWTELRSLPPNDYYFANVHGDLNVRNIFVRWNASDTILIDFANSGSSEFLARDPAKLDTSIALMCGDPGSKLLSLDCLRELYKEPLLPMRSRIKIDARIEAIRSIRSQAGGEGISNNEYEILVACHLLRYATHIPGATNVDAKLAPRRALCYSLACSLVLRVSEHMKASRSHP